MCGGQMLWRGVGKRGTRRGVQLMLTLEVLQCGRLGKIGVLLMMLHRHLILQLLSRLILVGPVLVRGGVADGLGARLQQHGAGVGVWKQRPSSAVRPKEASSTGVPDWIAAVMRGATMSPRCGVVCSNDDESRVGMLIVYWRTTSVRWLLAIQLLLDDQMPANPICID